MGVAVRLPGLPVKDDRELSESRSVLGSTREKA
jgi:hypothetical protein